MELKWPSHKGELSLTHNAHRVNHETVAEYIEESDLGLSADEVQECIALDSIWELQWYPNTMVSFYIVAAPTFEKLMDAVKDFD